jgi:hypothetical protein
MAGPSSPLPEDDKKKIADANWLANDAPKAKSGGTPVGKAREVDSDHSYDVVDPIDPGPLNAAPVSPVRPVQGAPRKPKTKAEAPDNAVPSRSPATVDEVWTRRAEWGGHLTLIATVAGGIGLLIYLTMSYVSLMLAFLLFILGGVALLALCYPLFITLERPVRITPEQAAKDYYASLSHFLPHYRRMWLLLSSAGRVSDEFSTYEEFQSYWKRTLAQLAGGTASQFNPLEFTVAEFHSEKSAGMTALSAKFTVKIYRGEVSPANQVASYPITSGLVKGPDRMWYLNNGTIPAARK